MKALIKSITPNFILVSYRFKKVFGYYPNLFMPKTFNEKIVHRMLHPKKKYTTLADKFAVRNFIAEKIGSEYLVPLIWNGCFLSEDEFELLPLSFVIKSNHASGTNLIVKDKTKVDYNYVKKLTDSWLKIDFHTMNLEKHYKNIPRSLIVEKLLVSDSGGIPSDYKLHIFNNKENTVIYIQVDYDRFDDENGHTRDIYDENWNFMPIRIQYENSNYKEKKPLLLDEMISASKKLSSDFSYSRIDWYICGGKLYFGEITFTHGCATERFFPNKADLEWGKLWDIEYEKLL